MTRVISIASGKGGVGKTTVAANVGILLSKLGYKVLLIDADIAMANLSLLLGMQSSPITLHDVMLGESSIEDAIYEGPGKISFVPSGLSLESYRRIDADRLEPIIKSIAPRYDFVLIDCPAGVEKSVLSSVSAAEETLLVVAPNSASLVDALKTKNIAERLGAKVIGFIINFYRGEKGEATKEDISKMLELPCYGVIKYDDNLRKDFLDLGSPPLVIRNPNSPSYEGFKQVASKLSGVPEYKFPKEKKQGFLSWLFSIFFRKKPSLNEIKKQTNR